MLVAVLWDGLTRRATCEAFADYGQEHRFIWRLRSIAEVDVAAVMRPLANHRSGLRLRIPAVLEDDVAHEGRISLVQDDRDEMGLRDVLGWRRSDQYDSAPGTLVHFGSDAQRRV